jgi:hypothetical protein
MYSTEKKLIETSKQLGGLTKGNEHFKMAPDQPIKHP